MTTDTIVIVGVVVLLGLWWVVVVGMRRQADTNEPDARASRPEEPTPRGAEHENYAAPGTWHPAGVEYSTADRDDTTEPVRLAPGTCPACQTENDPFYTYCRSCVHRLHQF
jgi:hypothetical protein